MGEDEIIEMFDRCVLSNDAALGESTFGQGPAVFVGKREVAHVAGASTLDIRLTKETIRERRSELREDGRVRMRRNQSDWLEFDIETQMDLVAGEALLISAIESNRTTAPPGLPPSGAELERRRRFH